MDIHTTIGMSWKNEERKWRKMNNKSIQRKWAFVVAILFTLASINQLASGDIESGPYGGGQLLGCILIPVCLYVLAFKKKKAK